MDCKYRFKFTHKAESDLDGIIEYISLELCNQRAAIDFIDKLRNILDETCMFPQSGALIDNELLGNSEIRKKIVNNYILYYISDDEAKEIKVLRIVYARRNINEILVQLGL